VPNSFRYNVTQKRRVRIHRGGEEIFEINRQRNIPTRGRGGGIGFLKSYNRGMGVRTGKKISQRVGGLPLVILDWEANLEQRGVGLARISLRGTRTIMA